MAANAARLVSSSIVILAGAVTCTSQNKDVIGAGMLTILAGFGFFAASFLMSFKASHKGEG